MKPCVNLYNKWYTVKQVIYIGTKRMNSLLCRAFVLVSNTVLSEKAYKIQTSLKKRKESAISSVCRAQIHTRLLIIWRQETDPSLTDNLACGT